MSLGPDGGLPLGPVESRTKHHYVCSGCLIDRLGSGLRHGRLHRLTIEKVTTLKWLLKGGGTPMRAPTEMQLRAMSPERRIEVWSLDTANAVPCFGNAAPCLETARSPCPTSVSLPARSQRGQSIRRRLRETRRANVSRAALLYTIAAIVSRAKRARAVVCRFRASVSAELAPCFRAFLLPFRAPPPAPCIRQTLCPRTAGARHWSPLRFDLAWHLFARHISKSMGLFLRFFVRPSLRGGGADVADDRLPTLGDAGRVGL